MVALVKSNLIGNAIKTKGNNSLKKKKKKYNVLQSSVDFMAEFKV